MEGKNFNTTQKLMLVGLGLVVLGILATYIPWGGKDTQPTFEAAAPHVVEDKKEKKELSYEEDLEQKLGAILKELEGAGETKVMVTTRTSNEQVLAEEVVQVIESTDETDAAGRTKTDNKQDVERKVVMQDGDTPFIIKENRPEIEGVLVLAEGADNVEVKNAIIQAVASVLNVPVHKIAVFKMA